jgi:DNA methylase
VFDMLPTIQSGSVDCVCTSPPYWMLRSYLSKDHPLKPLELGSEATPAEFVENQVKVFRLVRDAMADHATCWLNIGDTYTHQRGKPGDKHGPKQCTNAGSVAMPSATIDGVTKGNMALIPQRLAIALQDDGWIVRSIIVWHKPAPMPASLSGWAWRQHRIRDKNFQHAKYGGKGAELDRHSASERMKMNVATARANGMPHDSAKVGHLGWIDCPGCPKCKKTAGLVLRRGSWRPTSSWEPILMLAKSASYFCDGEAVKTPAAAATLSRDTYTRILDDPDEQFAVRHDHETVCDSGANLRDVWSIAAEPLRAVRIVRRVRVAADAPCDGKKRITSPDCPVHGGRLGRVASGGRGGRSEGSQNRSDSSDSRPVLSPPVSPVPTEQPLGGCSSDDNADVLLQEGAPVAKRRSKRARKKGLAPETTFLDTSSEGIPSDTAHTLELPSSSGKNPDIPASKTGSDDLGDDRMRQIESDTAGTSVELESFEPLISPSIERCTCEYYTEITEELNHYAAFPSELVRRCLAAGTSSKGYCPTCGGPWVRVMETKEYGDWRRTDRALDREHGNGAESEKIHGDAFYTDYQGPKTLGWRSSCSCPEQPPRRGLVLDPYCGSGRTGLVARRLGLDFVGCELNPEYREMALRLLRDEMPLFHEATP